MTPADAQASLAAARAAFAAGRHDEALRQAESCLAAGGPADALGIAANAALALKAWDRAIAPLERLLQLNPGHDVVARMLSTARNNLGARALEAGRQADAQRAFAAALAAWPDNPEALFNQARMALEARRHAQALPPLRRLRALRPDDAQVALELFETELALAAPQDIPALVPQLRDAARVAKVDAMRLGAALADAGSAAEALAAIDALGGMAQFQPAFSLAFRLQDNVLVDEARRAFSRVAALGGRGERAPSLQACLGERLALPPVYASAAAVTEQRARFAGSLEALHAEFDDAAWGQTEVGGGGSSVSGDEGEEGFAPAGHVALAGGEESFAAEVVAGAAQFDVEAVFFAGEEDVGDVGRLHEAVTRVYPEKPVTFVFDGDAFVRRNLGDVFVGDGEKDELLVEDLVVFEVMEEDGRGAVGVGGHEDGGAADAMWFGVFDVGEELFEGQDVGGEGFGEDASAALPGGHDGEDEAGDEKREPAAVDDFGDVAGEKRDVDGQEQDDGR